MSTIFTPAIAVEKSQDKKLSPNCSVSATWVSQKSCPKTCPFYHNGCYAETSSCSYTTNRLNKCKETSKVKIAKKEAAAILTLTGTRDLRLHVVGDCANIKTAQIVSQAAEEYQRKHGKTVWTYTHSRIPREAWGQISILRSCTNLKQVNRSHGAGYASALVVPKLKSDKAYKIGQFKGIPCPHQTGKVKSCKDCRLCLNSQKLFENRSIILFTPHGEHKQLALKALG